jgi:DNA-binding transcriptional LysR family regulator
MDLTQLEYFVAVAEERSFTKGAQRAQIVQSAASAAVARLEREFDQELFLRSGRQIEITEAGRVMLGHARRILGGVQTARDDLDTLRGGLRGVVTLGTSIATGTIDLAAALATFHQRHPAVAVHLRLSLGPTQDHLDRVLDGTFDAALLPIPPVLPAGIAMDVIAHSRLALVCRPDHSLANAKQVRYRQLADETFVDFPQGWGNRVFIDSLFDADKSPRTVAVEVNDVATALALVSSGLGIAFVPEQFLGYQKELVAVDLLHPPATRTFGLAIAEHRPMSGATKALRNAIANQAHQQQNA